MDAKGHEDRDRGGNWSRNGDENVDEAGGERKSGNL